MHGLRKTQTEVWHGERAPEALVHGAALPFPSLCPALPCPSPCPALLALAYYQVFWFGVVEYSCIPRQAQDNATQLCRTTVLRVQRNKKTCFSLCVATQQDCAQKHPGAVKSRTTKQSTSYYHAFKMLVNCVLGCASVMFCSPMCFYQ